MKYVIIICSALLFFQSCKKNLGECKDYKEMPDVKTLNSAQLAQAPELLDTLAKYPNLRAYRFSNDNMSWEAACHLYYKGLQLLNYDYVLYKSYATGMVQASDSVLVKNISVSVTPAVSYKDAISEARLNVNFDYSCIAYKAGIFDLSGGYGLPNYRLVWKIVKSGSDYPFVIIDAQDKRVLQVATGIYAD